MHNWSTALFICCLCLRTQAAPFPPSAKPGSLLTSPNTSRRTFVAEVSKLRKHDRERLSTARVNGKSEVAVCIASLSGGNEAVARQAKNSGAEVRYRDDDVDYLRLKVPIDRVEEVAKINGIKAININDGGVIYSTGYQDDNRTTTDGSPRQDIPAPSTDTPDENPYVPTRDIGAPQFTAKHPTFDGRGVTIAVFEGYIADFTAPELQTATTLDGKPTRKMIDVINATEPDIPEPNSFAQVDMIDKAIANKGHLTFKGVTYKVPSDGNYRVGVYSSHFDQSPYYKRNLNRLGMEPEESGKYAVLWDENANTVWVDTDQNYDFSDEKGLTDYNLRFDAGQFGKDDPTTLQPESLGFIVLADPKYRFLRILPAFGSHLTQTTAAAAGRGFLGGKMNGAAPGAQVISVFNDAGIAGQIEGMIAAVKHPKVDIVTMQYVFLMRLNDGYSTESIIFDRLVKKYKKLIFISNSNSGPGLNTVAENAAGSEVIGVGAYLHKDTWRSLYGLNSNRDEQVANLSSRGPGKAGGGKPDIIAPGITLTISNTALEFDGNDPFVAPKGINYKLPRGYRVVYGTSFSAPIAAGGAALLISAAKQNGIPYDAERLRWAIKSSARYLPGFGAHEQGSGLMQVEAAWEALKRAPKLSEIGSRAPIKASMSTSLNETNQGQGIYEREGWVAGQTGSRNIILTRNAGEKRAAVYRLKWEGDKETFNSPETVSLPLNVPVSVPVAIAPKRSGVHSAILSLDDSKGSASIHEVMNTVVAAEQFNEGNGFTVTRKGRVGYPGFDSTFLNVPKDTSALKVNLSAITDQKQLLLKLIDPAGNYAGQSPYLGNSALTIADPEPGVWEVIAVNGNDGFRTEVPKQAQGAADFIVSATVLGVQSPAASNVETSKTNEINLTMDLINQLGKFDGGISNTFLGSSFSERALVSVGGQPRVYEINVPAGSTKLRAAIKGASDLGADLDLYAYNCSSTPCNLIKYSVGDSAEEVVTVDAPQEGLWKVVIDPVSIPSGKTSIEYSDFFVNSAFGSIKPVEKPGLREGGAKWSESARIKIEAEPLAPRSLVAVMEVSSIKPETVRFQFQFNSGASTPVQRHVTLGSAMVRIDAK